MSGSKYKEAYIDMSVVCMSCGDVLYSGAYLPGRIAKVKKLIKDNGWIHHPEDGTLCPICLKCRETE